MIYGIDSAPDAQSNHLFVGITLAHHTKSRTWPYQGWIIFLYHLLTVYSSVCVKGAYEENDNVKCVELARYFVTDVQQILSGHNLVIVDPHKTYTEGIECRKNMVFLDITDMTDDVEDEVCDDQLEPFKCIDEYVQKGVRAQASLLVQLCLI